MTKPLHAFSRWFAAASLLLTAATVRSDGSSEYSTAVNWPAFLARHDMRFEHLPSGWQGIEFHELRTEGAFLVSAKRHAGRTEWVRIKSLAGEPCRVRTDLAGEVTAQGARQFKLREVSPALYEVDLQLNSQSSITT